MKYDYDPEKKSRASKQAWAKRRAEGRDKQPHELVARRVASTKANRLAARAKMSPAERRSATLEERKARAARSRAGWRTRRRNLGLAPGPAEPTRSVALFSSDVVALRGIHPDVKQAVRMMLLAAGSPQDAPLPLPLPHPPAALQNFSNHWKHFFQSLENPRKYFPIVGKRHPSARRCAGGGDFPLATHRRAVVSKKTLAHPAVQGTVPMVAVLLFPRQTPTGDAIMSNATESLAVLAALRALAATIPDAALRKRIEAALDGKAAAEPEIQRKVIDGNEAAKILGCRRRTIQKLAAEGRIAVVRLPGRRLACGYLRESVEALAAGEVRTAG